MKLMFKTKIQKLKSVLQYNFSNKLTDDEIDILIKIFNDFEKSNIDTIEKLKRDKIYETKRISGAIKQCLNAHGPITKQYIGSATKRIYGALLDNVKKESFIRRIINKIWKK
jgi:hypothetical protein